MGSFNGTCAISNLHIAGGTDVTVFLLLKNMEPKSFCYGNALYDVSPFPFYGKYDDYGGVENCHGTGLNVTMEILRSQLYEFGQGANDYHDCVMNKDTLDVSSLFRADHAGRLGVQHLNAWDSDSFALGELKRKAIDHELSSSQAFELNRLSAKIKQIDTFRPVTHVLVHNTVFRNILDKWYIEEYVGDGKGTHGWENNYIRIHFKDLVDSIPEFINRKKEQKTALDNGALGNRRLFMNAYCDEWKHDEPCLAIRWMRYFERGESSPYGLIAVSELVENYIETEDWNTLSIIVQELLTTAWINAFMSQTNKIWTKQISGGQDRTADGYKVLADTVLEILADEKAEWDSENVGDDEDDVDDNV